MSQQRCIVDGYNLIHKIPALAKLLPVDLERARERLVAELERYSAARKVRVTVVFDGQSTSVGSIPRRHFGVDVVYSRHPQSADDVIKRMMAVEKHPRACLLVSSDNSIGLHARDYGVRVVSAADFASELLALGRGPSVRGDESSAEKPEMTPGEVAKWEDFFRRGRQAASQERGERGSSGRRAGRASR